MNFPNTSQWEFTLLGIDPGSSNLGISIYKLDFNTLAIKESFAFTISAKDTCFYNRNTSNEFGDKIARLQAMKSELAEVFRSYSPSLIVCESPFFNSFTPNAYAILIEVVNLIHETIWEYNYQIPFFKVDPPTAKKAVGAKGNAKKDEMTQAIIEIKDRLKLKNNPLDLDEHSIDALAIGHYGYLNYVLNLNR